MNIMSRKEELNILLEEIIKNMKNQLRYIGNSATISLSSKDFVATYTLFNQRKEELDNYLKELDNLNNQSK